MAGFMPTGIMPTRAISGKALAPPQAPQGGSGLAPPRNDAVRDDVAADEDGNVTPEEQAAYEEFVLNGYELLYEGGEVRPGILELLDEKPDDLMAVLGNVELERFSPVVALAATTTIVVLELVRRYGEDQPDGAIILHGGKDLLEELAEIAGLYGSHDYSEEEMSEAFRMGADLYREAAADIGLVDLDALKAEFAEIVAADREGRSAELLPGLDRQPQRQAQMQPQAQPQRGEGRYDELRG